MNFHETVMGQRFFERQLPQLIATCSADEREWTFSVGFRAAMNMTACGWTAPKPSGKDGA